MSLGLALGATLAAPACTAGLECTQVGCEHEAVATYPSGLVSGPYDLYLDGQTDMIVARCNDPSAPEAAENPEGLTCDSGGFMLVGHPLANERSVRLTIIDPMTEEVLVENVEVFLDAVDEIRPNGPDCPPVCYVRNGALILP